MKEYRSEWSDKEIETMRNDFGNLLTHVYKKYHMDQDDFIVKVLGLEV